jgi:starch phosphorylase
MGGKMPKKAIAKTWSPIYKEMTKDGLKISFSNNRQYLLAKDQYTATAYDNFVAMAVAIRDRIIERWIATQQYYHDEDLKRVYYFSLEFLIGRLLSNNIINLGLWKEAKTAAQDLGYNLEDILDEEADAGLGNGGLGRLAACFLDSLATLGIPAHGYGIRYDYGIFNQKIVNGYQVESPDEWLKFGNPWEFARPEYKVQVKFYGNTNMFRDKNGKLRVKWVNTQDVLAVAHDIPVPGYKNDVVNTLRLWSARSTEEFDFGYFNYGDYERAVYGKVSSENISKVLYPNDNVIQGKELRLKQEYFFVAASISDIIRRFTVDNKDLYDLPQKIAIQLNDTHPALAIPELMRILLDDENFDWETAWDITVRIFAYTNHTVMPEALETWLVTMFESLLPRHLQIIYEINFRFLREVAVKFPGDNSRLRRMSLIEESGPKRIRMAYLAIVGSHAVNGVSIMHTNLLKTSIFKDFYELSPDKFNNKTNGISPRRWLKQANPRLSDLITEAIGDKWVTNLYELERLLPLKEDSSFRKKWQKVKLENKVNLAAYIREQTGISVDENTLFDAHVKRIHEYKRQLLFSFYIISQYLRLKNDPGAFSAPRTFICSGKTAPGYFMAKLIIKFINSVAEVINNDRSLGGKIKLLFLENYGVSLAERIFPAGDVSEQISTAGTEASGTGCMKFMVNGGLTVGTHDGANIEISRAVGYDNIFLFGLKSPEVDDLRRRGYNPYEYIEQNPALKETIDLIRSNFFSPVEHGLFEPIVNDIVRSDHFLVCADFPAYCRIQDIVSGVYYRDSEEWTKKSIVNVAKSGRFSSDRTIAEYAEQIWDVPFEKPE